jgi:hypothetical protein
MPSKACEHLIAEGFRSQILSLRPVREMTHRIGITLCGERRVAPALQILQETLQVATQEARFQETMEPVEPTTMLDHGTSFIARDDDRRRHIVMHSRYAIINAKSV